MSGPPAKGGESPPSAPPAASAQAYDQVGIQQPNGTLRMLRKAEFEALPLGERIRLLMTELKFFRNGEPVSTRDAMRLR